MNKKIEHGQFYTIGNPFLFQPFLQWFEHAYHLIENKIILEPFSGTQNIIKLIEGATQKEQTWHCFDIDSRILNEKLCYPTIIKDVLIDFPKKYELIITNPPYLARNSATRKSVNFNYNTKYNDLYKYCLSIMLENCDYIAAIIPETFIIQPEKELKERLELVISLKGKFFNDTDCPVCLALFSKEKVKDFKVYSNDEYVGYYQELYNKYNIKPIKTYPLKFNIPDGEISIITIDDHIGDNIKFQSGNIVKSEKIKNSSRSYTRVKLPFNSLDEKQIENIIIESNRLLKEYRNNTKDLFLASFKGLRKDGKYRRRLDFKTARNILNQAIFNIIN